MDFRIDNEVLRRLQVIQDDMSFSCKVNVLKILITDKYHEIKKKKAKNIG